MTLLVCRIVSINYMSHMNILFVLLVIAVIGEGTNVIIIYRQFDTTVHSISQHSLIQSLTHLQPSIVIVIVIVFRNVKRNRKRDPQLHMFAVRELVTGDVFVPCKKNNNKNKK